MSITPYEHEDGILAEGQGPYAPETLLSEAYSRRFVGTPLDDSIAPYLVITDYYAAVNVGTDEEPVASILNITEMMYCTDPDEPGGTEVNSEITYDDGFETYETVEHAAREARRHLEGWGLDFWSNNFKA